MRGDSLNWETAKQIIEFQRDVTNKQYNIAALGIAAIVILVVIALGINFWFIRREVRRDMEKAIKKLMDDFNTMQAKIRMDASRKLGEVDGAVDGKLGEVDKKMQLMNKKMESMDEKIEWMDKIRKWSDRSNAMVSVIVFAQIKDFSAAAYWSAEVIKGYANLKIDAKDDIKLWVDMLIDSLKECLKEDEKLESGYRKEIEKALSHIPESLNKEKKEIEGLLKKLP